ncbi:unnamed protein product [Arctogadus glacialis]
MAGFGSEYLKGETGSGSGKPSSPPSLEKESGEENMGELRRIRSEFIHKVSDPVIKGLLDDLTDHEVFSTEEKDSVMEDQRSRADRARPLIDMVMAKGEGASLMMIDCMKKRDKHLSITLGLIPSPAAVGEHVKNTSADLMTSDSFGEESSSRSEPSSPMCSFPHERRHRPQLHSCSSRQWSLSKPELSGAVDSESSLLFALSGSTLGEFNGESQFTPSPKPSSLTLTFSRSRAG